MYDDCVVTYRNSPYSQPMDDPIVYNDTRVAAHLFFPISPFRFYCLSFLFFLYPHVSVAFPVTDAFVLGRPLGNTVLF